MLKLILVITASGKPQTASNHLLFAVNVMIKVPIRQDDDAYATAKSEVVGHLTKIHPSFKHGQNRHQIMADFDQAEYNGFERSMGAEVKEKIIHGCKVYWKTSVNHVSNIVTKSKEEHLSPLWSCPPGP